MKQEGKPNDLIDRVKAADYFKPIHGQLDALLDPATFVGRAPEQVDDFVKEFRELRKTYHKRVMWGDRWTTGEVAWRDD